MIIAPPPPNEGARLAELASYDILDTVPEAAYDAITLLAAQICEVPIALISIVDEDRQWFKSRIGLAATETSRDVAFCAHAITSPESLLVVPDATADERFRDNPYVTGDPEIRFYAGAPLVTDSGNALGTICVIDRAPRTLRPDQEEALRALSTQVMALLELRWTVEELNRKQEELATFMKQREAFIATVSHEIRTPLSSVIGCIELLTDPASMLTPDEHAEMLGIVGRQAGDVAHLIDDLLVAAKTVTGGLQVQRVPVDMAAQAAQVLEGLDREQTRRVSVDVEPGRALGDPARVRQVLRNLLTNAFRYGGPNVSVDAESVDGRVRVAVSDDGPGVPADDVEAIFEQFGQTNGSRVASGSIGLGLPTARALAESMHGSLDYARIDDRTVFQFELPAISA